MTISATETLSNQGTIKVFTLENSLGSKVTITNLGATITNFWTKDKDGKLRDIVLGYDPIDSYFENTDTYFGATVGRSANRLAKAQFTLNDKQYQIPQNEGANNLHSGPKGYQIRLWGVGQVNPETSCLTLTLNSPDGDQGYPGNLAVSVIFELTDENELVITYKGISDQDTVFNLTNHSYFNLNGHDSGSIENHQMQVLADAFTPMIDSHSITSGEIRPVDQTPFDFRTSKTIGQDINEDYDQLVYAGGYDHNWVLNEPSMDKPFAIAQGNQSGIKLEAFTTLPGVQFYTGNFLNGNAGKDGASYSKRNGFCLETQFFPNALNNDIFASPIIKANEEYISQTKYKIC